MRQVLFFTECRQYSQHFCRYRGTLYLRGLTTTASTVSTLLSDCNKTKGYLEMLVHCNFPHNFVRKKPPLTEDLPTVLHTNACIYLNYLCASKISSVFASNIGHVKSVKTIANLVALPNSKFHYQQLDGFCTRKMSRAATMLLSYATRVRCWDV